MSDRIRRLVVGGGTLAAVLAEMVDLVMLPVDGPCLVWRYQDHPPKPSFRRSLLDGNHGTDSLAYRLPAVAGGGYPS